MLFVAEVRDDMQGGVSRHFRFLGEQLERLGYQVDYVFLEGMPKAWGKRLEGFTLDLCRRAYGGVERYVRREGAPSLIYWSLNTTFPFCLLRKYFDRFAGVPIIGMTFGVEERWWAQLRQDSRRKGGPRISLLHSFSTGWLRMKVLRLAGRACDHVICVSHEDRDYLIRNQKLPPARVTAISVGVDPAFIAPPSGERTRDGKRVLFLGTWIWRKGVQYLVEAMTRVMREEPDCSLSIVGTFQRDEEVLAHWPADLRSRIRPVSKVQGQELIREYAIHDIFVLPSLFEGMPLSLAEAMAAGMAVVTTETCGMRELVSDGENGVLVPPRNSEALSSAIIELLRDRRKQRRLGERGREMIGSRTWARISQEFLQVFKRYAPGLA